MPNRREQGRREYERNPGVSVEFFGWTHSPLDLQVVPQVRASLQKLITESYGPIIVYMEGVDATPETKAMVRKVDAEMGRQGAVLFPLLYLENGGEFPTARAVHERKERISNSQLPFIIANKLLPLQHISEYFIAGLIDDIREEARRQNRHLEIDSESHPATVRSMLVGLEAGWKAMLKQIRWGYTGFDSMLQIYLASQEKYIEMEKVRKPGIVSDLASRVKAIRNRGGSLFLMFGSTHMELPEDVRKSVDPASRFVGTRLNIKTPVNDHDVLVTIAMKKGEMPSEEMLARALFATQCAHSVYELFLHGGGNLQRCADNFQTIHASVQNVASDLSLEEIRRLNDSKEPILKIYFGHPAARAVLPFLH